MRPSWGVQIGTWANTANRLVSRHITRRHWYARRRYALPNLSGVLQGTVTGKPATVPLTNPSRLTLATLEGSGAVRSAVGRAMIKTERAEMSGGPPVDPPAPIVMSAQSTAGPSVPAPATFLSFGAMSGAAPAAAPMPSGLAVSSGSMGTQTAQLVRATNGEWFWQYPSHPVSVPATAPVSQPSLPSWVGQVAPPTQAPRILAGTPMTQRRVQTAIASYGGVTISDTTGIPGYGYASSYSPSFSVAPGYAPGLSEGLRMPGVTNPVANGGGTTPPIKLEAPPLGTSSAFAPPTGPMQSQALTSANPSGFVNAATNRTTQWTGYGGMPSHIKNAVKMIQPFYSENATVEKAKSFWNAFERATVGLDEQLRLSAFR
ncbi:hypothetical protein PI125_g22140 [Phytophthora idaei]|nr:hypothetical protein PI125_g22140 [Phytophthora idaei]